MLTVETLQDIEKCKKEGKRGLITSLTSRTTGEILVYLVQCPVLSFRTSLVGRHLSRNGILSATSLCDGRMGSGVWTGTPSSWCSEMAGRGMTGDKRHVHPCPTLCSVPPQNVEQREYEVRTRKSLVIVYRVHRGKWQKGLIAQTPEPEQWGSNPSSTKSCCVLGELPHLSVSQFPHCKYGH